MVSMGKTQRQPGQSNSVFSQTFLKNQKQQNRQNMIPGQNSSNNMFAARNSVRDIRRMLTGNSQGMQENGINSFGQNSVISGSQSYSESLQMKRQQSKNTTLALKKLKYQFKNISSRILRSKTSQAAKQAAGQARREVMRLKQQKRSGDYDSDEIEAAINHAKAMERVAKKKAKHLEEEELVKAAGGIWQGEKICTDEEGEEDRHSDIKEDTREEEGTGTEEEISDEEFDMSAWEDDFPSQIGDLMSEMNDIASGLMQEFYDSMKDMLEETGMDELSGEVLSVDKDIDPADLKMLKIKHRNKEMKEIVKADAEYLKAVFDHLEKMKDNVTIAAGSGTGVSGGAAGTLFSADAAGIGEAAAPSPVINITL